MIINLRENITRTITYSIVTICKCNGEIYNSYTVYGTTNEKKEMIKFLKTNDGYLIPTISVKTVTERRTMTLDNFLNNSILINESEEN